MFDITPNSVVEEEKKIRPKFIIQFQFLDIRMECSQQWHTQDTPVMRKATFKQQHFKNFLCNQLLIALLNPNYIWVSHCM